jgi:opacity protein-like surface antigen
MTMRSISRFAALAAAGFCVAAFAVPAPASAQSTTTTTTSSTSTSDNDSDDPLALRQPIGNVGIHGGMIKSDNAEEGKFQGGLHFEITPGRFLGFQAAVDYRTEERLDFMTGDQHAEVDVRTLPITLSGKLYLPIVPRFSPYGIAGAGWYHQKLDFSPALESAGFQDRKDTTFGWHLGLGGAVALSDRVGLFGEGRWIFVDPNRDLNPATQDKIEDFDFDSSQFLAGLNFFF